MSSPAPILLEILPSTNLRTLPSTGAASVIFGVSADRLIRAQALPAGQAEGFDWWRIDLPPGDVLAVKLAPFVPELYVRGDRVQAVQISAPPTPVLTQPVVDPPPVVAPPPGTLIGAHPALPALAPHQLLGVHMLEAGQPQLGDFLRAGCRSFTILGNVGAARDARAAGAAVIYRRFIDHGHVPDPAEFARNIGLSANDAVMVMGINEADNIATDALRQRFEWERVFAETIWALYPNCFPVIGGFSMGTPRIEDAGVAAEWRATYGAFLNANAHRVGLNYHSYSGRPAESFPPRTVPVIEPKWFELRHIEFTYNPALGALDRRVLLVSDESGVDVQGVGGFPDCGYDDALFMTWYQQRMAHFAPHPQQYVFNLFQGDDHNTRWGGYRVRRYLGPLSTIWSGSVPRAFMPVPRDAGTNSPLPAEWSPPAKRVQRGEG
jgi:hypothetical protein